MLQLTYSNRLEVLTAPLAAHVAQAQAEDPLRPVTILIPDQAVAQFLRLHLAEQHGVAANLDFQFLQGWLTAQVEAAQAGLRVLDRAALTSLLHARLLRPELLETEALRPIRRWLTAASGPVERARRPLQLAQRIAKLFEEYSYHRRGLIATWAWGFALQDTPWAQAERWQRALWQALFDGQGVARITPGAPSLTGAGQLDLFGSGPRHLLLPDALRALPPAQLPLPPAVHLFGLSYVAPAFTEIFARLAQASTLWIYTLNPCMEFWEDVDASGLGGIQRDGFARRAEAVDLESGEDPFGLLAQGDTPALRLWGRPSREYIRQLNQLTDCRYAPGFVDPTADGATLLTRLQRDILIRHPERAPRPDGPDPAPPDDSIRFLACPSARREVEVVADAIWALIARADAAGEGLRFHQIAVLVADAEREAYLTHIEAVFRERHDLPFNLVDRRLSARSRILEAIDRLLDLPFGQFEPQDLLPLLTHPALVGAMPEVDLDRWRDWIRALNVRFGADADDLSDTFIDLDVHNWDQALRRLALGACMTGPKAGDQRIFTTPDGGQWIPHDAQGDALVDASRLITLARSLIADARAVRDRQLSLADWCAWLRILLSRYLTPVEPADEVALARCLGAFERLAASDLEGEPIAYPALRDLARERLAALDAGRGQHQADGVVVSSLLPMRAIPFQAIFVLGLGANQFPAGGRLDPLDLRQARRLAGDVRPAERDRHLFLELLLACRRQLTVSWVARDDTTGEAREPSAVVRELQYTLRGFLGPAALDALTTRPPLSPADPGCFPDLFDGAAPADPALRPSPEARRAAQAAALRQRLRHQTAGDLPSGPDLLAALAPSVTYQLRDLLHLPPPPGQGARSDGPLHLPLSALQRFLESPLQGAARYTLGLEEAESLDVELDEPVDLDRGQRFGLLREAFWGGAGDPDRTRACYAALRDRARLAGALPLGIFGERSQALDLEILAAWRQNLAGFNLHDLSGWRTVRVGRAQEHGPVDDLLPAIELSVPRPDGAPLAVHLHGPLLKRAPNGFFVARNLSSATAEEKHFLPGFITMVALAALDALPGDRFGVIANPTREAPPGDISRRYQPVPSPAQARDWLTGVVRDLLFEPHDYRFPIEVALRWQRDREQRGPAARIFINPRNDNASRFGPVRDPGRFPPPDPARAAEILERRLMPFLRSAQPGKRGA